MFKFLLTLLFSANLFALSVPNSFTSEQVISSSEINANFNHVTDRLDTVETRYFASGSTGNFQGNTGGEDYFTILSITLDPGTYYISGGVNIARDSGSASLSRMDVVWSLAQDSNNSSAPTHLNNLSNSPNLSVLSNSTLVYRHNYDTAILGSGFNGGLFPLYLSVSAQTTIYLNITGVFSGTWRCNGSAFAQRLQ